MFKFKPKKVFEKLNKMDRKQAYTIGSIVVVLVVALILLISAATGGDEDASFAGMNARGYDLAQMPFATDEAEKFLLANVYPDMKENGSTLLYSAEEKEKRQEEDAKGTELELSVDKENANEEEENYSSSGSSGSSAHGGYGGYGSGRAGGSGKTEIGTLSSAGGMARAGGSGINATYGPSGDFRQLQRKEKNDIGGPTQLQTGNARQDLNRYHAANIATARINENKGVNAKKAMFEGNIKGSDAFNKDGSVDLQKLQEGGLSLDTSAPPTTTDLSNLDDKIADAAQKAKDADNKNKDQKKDFWEDLWQGLVKGVVDKLVDVGTNWLGDKLIGFRNSFVAGRDFDRSQVGKSFKDLDPSVQKKFMEDKNLTFEYDADGKITDKSWNEISQKWDALPAKEQQQTAHDSAAHDIARNGGAARSEGYTRDSHTNQNNEKNIGQGLDCGGKSPIMTETTDENGTKTVTYKCP